MMLSSNAKFILAFLIMVIDLSFETSFEMKEKDSKASDFLKNKGSSADDTSKMSIFAKINSSNQLDKVDPVNKLEKVSNMLEISSGALGTEEIYDINIGNGPIYFTAWMKYIKFSDVKQANIFPSHFYKNNEFFEQKKIFPKANLNEMSTDGNRVLNTYIKSQSHFYVVLFKNSLNFISSRQKQLHKTSDAITIKAIKHVAEGNISRNINDGIQDFGNFSEGFCLKILSNQPQLVYWVLCADTKQEKDNLIDTLRKMKIKEQRENGLFVGDRPKVETIFSIMNPDMGPSQTLKTDKSGNLGVTFDSKTQHINDGYWIVLQDWTQCNLKCGGGKSTLHRMCVPPKSGGAPCVGEAILEKPCNTQPCPNVYGTNIISPLKNTVLHKPILMEMSVTSYPQRYSKCVIKESDLMLVQDNKDGIKENYPLQVNSNNLPKLQIPVRVVMNNRTITIFEGQDYHTQVNTFTISNTLFKRSSFHKGCFILIEQSNNAELCPFIYNSNGKMVEEWDYDFNLFKYQCFKPRDKMEIGLDVKFNQKLQEKIINAKRDILIERENAKMNNFYKLNNNYP